MRGTLPLLHKNFWGRSVDELKRYSNIVFKLEGIRGPSGPYPLHSFHNPTSIQDCNVMSDEDIGGFSRAQLDWVSFPSQEPRQPSPPPEPPMPGKPQGYAHFHGHVSTRLPPARPDVHRSGYAAFRTSDRPPTIFGKSLWDIDPYIYLALRVRSDGRAWFVNVQTESIVPSDLHQHRLFAKRPGRWETVLIKWNDFVRTNHGFVVEPQAEMLRQRVKSIGLGLTDRVEGPFDLCVESVWATNDASEATQDGVGDEHKLTNGEATWTSSAVSDVIHVNDTDGSCPRLQEGHHQAEQEAEGAGPEGWSGKLKDKHGKTISWMYDAGR